MEAPDHRQHWHREIATLARQVNLGWWAQRWWPVSCALLIIASLAILGWRALRNELPATWPMMLGALIAVSALWAWWRARASFESLATARVRLESALGLHAALSAAADGARPWPSPQVAPTLMTWQWQRPLTAMLLSAVMVMLAVRVPLAEAKSDTKRTIEKPTAVRQVEQWMEELRKEDAVDPKELEETKAKIAELMERPNEQWYEHASLEAADHLRDETGKHLQELGTQLEQTRGGLETLAQIGSQLSQEAKSGLAKQFENNLQGLRSGAMQANSDLMQQLKQMDPSAMKNMSPEQMKKLAERLKQNADALRKALANAPQFDFKECECDKPGNGPKPGRGGIDRGKGDAKLTLSEDEANLHQKRTETAKQMLDPERVAPGDMLSLQDAAPQTERNYTGPKGGGAIQSTGSGGAAIDHSALLPAERSAVQRFFK
jgi:hypothetical protein